VQVEVKNGLPTVRADISNNAIASLFKPLTSSDLCGFEHQLSKQLSVGFTCR
jgi:hypothetical protein